MKALKHAVEHMPSEQLEGVRTGARRAVRLDQRVAVAVEEVCKRHDVYCVYSGTTDMGTTTLYVDRWLHAFVLSWIDFAYETRGLPDSLDRVLQVLPATAINTAFMLDDKSVHRLVEQFPPEALI